MDGMEAWSLIAPIISAHSIVVGGKTSVMDEAYVTVYCALKYWDKHAKDREKENNE